MTTRTYRKTVAPTRTTCALCGIDKYAHDMGTVTIWDVPTPTSFSKADVVAPWCKRCQHQTYSSKDNNKHIRLLTVRDAFSKSLSAHRYPCKQCKEQRGAGMYHWGVRNHYLTGVPAATRAHRCLICARTDRTQKNKSLASERGVPAAYDIAHDAIVQRTGRKIEQWGRELHHIHCILMRGLAKVPHTHDTDKADVWQTIEQKWGTWAGLTMGSPNNSAPLSSATLSSSPV